MLVAALLPRADLPPHPARAQDAQNVRVVGRWPYGPAFAVTVGEISGVPYAFLGSGGGVLVLDRTKPQQPVKVGEATTPGIVRGLFLLVGLRAGDVNGDGVIDVKDLALVGGNFGLSQSPWQ